MRYTRTKWFYHEAGATAPSFVLIFFVAPSSVARAGGAFTPRTPTSWPPSGSTARFLFSPVCVPSSLDSVEVDATFGTDFPFCRPPPPPERPPRLPRPPRPPRPPLPPLVFEPPPAAVIKAAFAATCARSIWNAFSSSSDYSLLVRQWQCED